MQGDPITFDVTPEMVGISGVTFDTTTSPNGYTAYISSGPEYAAEWSCRAGTGEDAPEGYQDPEIRTASVVSPWRAPALLACPRVHHW